jgi:RNA-directed DNA polymerase
VNRKRQNNQQELAFEPRDRGEAPARGDEETEPSMAKSATENPAFTEQLMEEGCDREILERAAIRIIVLNRYLG